MNENIVPQMFEDLTKKVNKIICLLSEQNLTSNLNEIYSLKDEVENSRNSILNLLETIEQKINQPQTQKKYVIHSINGKSLGILIPVILLIVFLVTTLVFTYKLKDVNNRLSDNDLKYRFIKMYNSIDSLNLYKLEDTFHYNRNQKAIDQMMIDVDKYEKALKKHTEAIEQAKMRGEETITIKFKYQDYAK